MRRYILVLTLSGCLAGCASDSMPADYNAAVYQAQIRTTLDAAFACERDYVHAHMQSPATSSEIVDAAIAACGAPISAAVQANLSEVVARLENSLTAAQVARERAAARADILKKLRADATQLLVNGRAPSAPQ